MFFLKTVVLSTLLSLFVSSVAHAQCSRFVGSTSDAASSSKATWRTDYPTGSSTSAMPWLSHNFATDPSGYMNAVLDTARASFVRRDELLKGTGTEQWWISLWMDYDLAGREPIMGLTKERGPKKRDLSITSERGSQVWAVGFYNGIGAKKLGEVFADSCNLDIPAALKFDEGTASIKFLFTDANLEQFANQVSYLSGGPKYTALIDPAGAGDAAPVTGRIERKVQLLQVDIAVRDSRATETGWIFGTFGWVGPPSGDGLFDNLVPVSLQWANDEANYSLSMSDSWINPEISNKMFGWPERPSLGFNGRANGPADNIRSSCLSCHSAARIPRSSKGLLGFGFQIPADLSDPAKVKVHVNTWFNNLQPGEMFDPNNPPGVAALDYSLQIESATTRICQACEDGAMSGTTPQICKLSGYYTEQNCKTVSLMSVIAAQNKRISLPLPRQ